jgi:hypothetical protein
MLAVFDLPLVPNHFQQALWPGLLGPKTGHFVGDFFGVFENLATPALALTRMDPPVLTRSDPRRRMADGFLFQEGGGEPHVPTAPHVLDTLFTETQSCFLQGQRP